MTLTSFSKPSDTDVLRHIICNKKAISFVGKGSIHQKENETVYRRTVKITSNKEEILQDVIYIKKGITWLFKAIENITTINDPAMIKEKV